MPATPPIVAGGSDAPREVNLIAKDYSFLPATLDLVPGETVLLHVINGGLEVHEAVIGDAAVQDAWEGPRPPSPGRRRDRRRVVSVPPDVAGLRIVVRSGRAGGRRLDGPVGRPAAAAASSSAATSPATGSVACRSPCAGSAPRERARWYALDPRRRGRADRISTSLEEDAA